MSQSYFYIGDLAELRVYTEALNDEQINQIYQYGKTVLKGK